MGNHREQRRAVVLVAMAAVLAMMVGATQGTPRLHRQEGTPLSGSPCEVAEDCSNSLGNGHRSTASLCHNGRCKCPPYHLQVNGTVCLPGRLLGFKCSTDSQCRVRVSMSGCLQGVCQCSDGYTPYRRANCLKEAKVGDACRTQGQCRTSSSHAYCNFSIPRVYGRCACTPEYIATKDGLCAARQLGLGSSCVSSRQCNLRVRGSVCKAPHEDALSFAVYNRITAIPGVDRDDEARGKHTTGGVCECPKGHAAENSKCIPLGKEIGESAVSLGQRCARSTQCRATDPNSRCSSAGVCDCVVPTHSCSATKTGCHPDTFQCVSSGRCISSHFVCDGTPQCEDYSDEAHCMGGRCSSHSFRCPSGRCISRGSICDGKDDCDDGADEKTCRDNCPVSTFKCGDGRCLPGYVFCNALPSCSDESDEDHKACILGAPRLRYCPFRCNNGRCRSLSVLCSGKDGCGDNSDEEKCEVCVCPAV